MGRLVHDEGWRVMGRRLTEGRAARRGGGRTAVVVLAAAVCAVAGLPGQAAAAGTPSPYAFAEGAEVVAGATSNVEGHRLVPGATYKSSLPRAGQRFYRLELKAKESAYVSATAVPKLGTRVSYSDGLKVSVQDADGYNCSPLDSEKARFGSSESARPITATASRRVGPEEKSCKGAGTYYVLVERTSDPASGQEDWDLELRITSEPALRKRSATVPPESWDSASPEPPRGERRLREGGTSFNKARGLGTGVWGDRIEPGETRFYRVPVDWGQRLSIGAELGSSTGGRLERDRGFVSTALVLSLTNPVRAQVDDADTAYDGTQSSTALGPLPPVAYENRFAPADRVAATRFAGWYYLSVHLNPDVAGKFGRAPLDVTLRVTVDGAARPGPEYAGSAKPADEFSVTERDTEAAQQGETAAGSRADGGDDRVMAVVAAGGIGTGVGLLAILGVWTLIARRRAAAAVALPGAAVPGAGPAQFGPPRGW
ncbi:hypothetical protein ACFWZ2_35615 [Streptomyces sp. NPDC059002]|uniref:hypothetical protein n=1 Tax=Streptomyces sp. NPDC059002 TaxID=3346690 RepID=UPI00367C7E9E